MIGATMGTWSARTPDVKSTVGLGDAGWGLITMASAIGTILTLAYVTRVIGRTGARPMVVIGPVVMLGGLTACFFVGSQLALVLFLLIWGVGVGLSNTANVYAVSVERERRKPTMGFFHASFSIGLLAGSGITALAVLAGVSAGPQVALTAVVLLLALARLAPRPPRDILRRNPEEAPISEGAAPPARTPRQIWLIGMVAMLGQFAEGASFAWMAVYASERLGASDFVAGMIVTGFASAQLIGRLLGDRYVAAVGRRLTLVGSGLVGAVALTLGLIVNDVPSVAAGFFLLGGSLATIVPTAYGAAGNHPEYGSGIAIAKVSLLGQPGLLSGPLLIGLASTVVGLRWGLMLIPLASCLLALISLRIRDHGILG